MAGDLRNLAPQHYKAMVLRLEGRGYAEIAAQLKRTERTVRSWFNQEPVFQAAWERERAEAREQALAILHGAGPSAARHVIASQDARSEMVALLAAKDILDRIGLKPADKANVTHDHEGEITIRVEYADADDSDAPPAPGATPDHR